MLNRLLRILKIKYYRWYKALKPYLFLIGSINFIIWLLWGTINYFIEHMYTSTPLHTEDWIAFFIVISTVILVITSIYSKIKNRNDTDAVPDDLDI